MASVRKSPRSRFWYACITDATGKQRQFSTGLEDREEALAAATAIERSLKRHATAPHKLRDALERIILEYTPAADIDPGPWLLGWAAARKNETAHSTWLVYDGVARDAVAWLADAGINQFSALTSARVIELRDWWATKNQASTANGKIKVLRIALKAAVAAKLLEQNPADGVPKLKEKKTIRREFRPAELEVLAPTLSGEWLAVFQLGLNTGQRLNDLAELRWHQIDIAAATITFHARKTDTLVCLPLLQPSVDALALIPSSDNPKDPVFPVLCSVKREARSNQFRGFLAAVGLAKDRHDKKDAPSSKRAISELSFHSLRHTTSSMLQAAGVSKGIAMAILGHSSEAVNSRYTHIDMATTREALEKMRAF